MISDARGAGHAANGWITLRNQRVARQVVFAHVSRDVVAGPIGERVNFDLEVIFFKKRKGLPLPALELFATCNPASKAP